MSKFCNLLSNQYHVTYDVVKPCCWIKDVKESILDTTAIKKQFEKYSTVDTWIPECEYCHTLEKNGAESPRLMSLSSDIFFDNPALGDSVKVEVQIDDECNAACLMCSSWNSTTWQQYTEKTVKDKTIHFKHNIPVADRLQSVMEIIDFAKVRQLHFFGGEPLKTNTHLQVLAKIPNPELVRLVYVTNGSIAPTQELINLWTRFKFVDVNISIDGIEEHFNYLRWPLQWKQVETNIQQFAKLPASKFRITSSFIATPFNMFYHDRYINWATEFFKGTNVDSSHWFSYPNPVVGIINLSCVPNSLATMITNRFGQESRLVQLLQPFDQAQFDKFIQYVEFHDKHRQLNWREIFPEISNHFGN